MNGVTAMEKQIKAVAPEILLEEYRQLLASDEEIEALPLVVLEAQMCGIRCVLSDGVPSESILLENTRKMPAGATAQVMSTKNSFQCRLKYPKKIASGDFR